MARIWSFSFSRPSLQRAHHPHRREHGRPHIAGKWGQLIPPRKMDEKLKSENMQKKQQFSIFMLYFESNQGRQV